MTPNPLPSKGNRVVLSNEKTTLPEATTIYVGVNVIDVMFEGAKAAVSFDLPEWTVTVVPPPLPTFEPGDLIEARDPDDNDRPVILFRAHDTWVDSALDHYFNLSDLTDIKILHRQADAREASASDDRARPSGSPEKASAEGGAA